MQWANVDIKNIYARCKVYSDKTMPLFFDSELNDQKFYTIGNVTFINVKLTNVTYEGGQALFRMHATNTLIYNMTATDIGFRYNFLQSYNVFENL